MSRGVRGRVNLWLRSERAFGLRALPVKLHHRITPLPAGELAVRTPPSVPPPGTLDPRRDAPTTIYKDIRKPNEMAPAGGLIPPPSREPFTAPLLPTDQKRIRLSQMDEKEVRGCPRCRLCETRTNTVFGEGSVDAKIFFIGEGPGENEDLTGRPFVGRAGELLNKQIAAMGLQRQDVYIANIVKCRPPGNRAPSPDEVATCTPYLERQLEIIRPQVIVTLGLPAARYMLDTKLSMTRLRGQWQEWRGIRLMPTFHPAYVLRQYTAAVRGAVWSDLQQVMAAVGLPLPKGTSDV